MKKTEDWVAEWVNNSEMYTPTAFIERIQLDAEHSALERAAEECRKFLAKPTHESTATILYRNIRNLISERRT